MKTGVLVILLIILGLAIMVVDAFNNRACREPVQGEMRIMHVENGKTVCEYYK